MPQEKTIAIVLGASAWPKSEGRWQSSPNFAQSASLFKSYIASSEGMSLAGREILDLFDDKRSADDIDALIEAFIIRNENVKNIIVYYVGHGAFTDRDRRYCLAVRSTRIRALGQSGYRVASLARTLSVNRNQARTFIIIDACFSAAAEIDFIPMSDLSISIDNQSKIAVAESGVALLCASSSIDFALSPIAGRVTMFSGALLQALETGSRIRPRLLSFKDLFEITKENIMTSFPADGVAPQLHVPDQRRGDISTIGLFPNGSFPRAGENEDEDEDEGEDENRDDDRNTGVPRTKPRQIVDFLVIFTIFGGICFVIYIYSIVVNQPLSPPSAVSMAVDNLPSIRAAESLKNTVIDGLLQADKTKYTFTSLKVASADAELGWIVMTGSESSVTHADGGLSESFETYRLSFPLGETLVSYDKDVLRLSCKNQIGCIRKEHGGREVLFLSEISLQQSGRARAETFVELMQSAARYEKPRHG